METDKTRAQKRAWFLANRERLARERRERRANDYAHRMKLREAARARYNAASEHVRDDQPKLLDPAESLELKTKWFEKFGDNRHRSLSAVRSVDGCSRKAKLSSD